MNASLIQYYMDANEGVEDGADESCIIELGAVVGTEFGAGLSGVSDDKGVGPGVGDGAGEVVGPSVSGCDGEGVVCSVIGVGGGEVTGPSTDGSIVEGVVVSVGGSDGEAVGGRVGTAAATGLDAGIGVSVALRVGVRLGSRVDMEVGTSRSVGAGAVVGAPVNGARLGGGEDTEVGVGVVVGAPADGALLGLGERDGDRVSFVVLVLVSWLLGAGVGGSGPNLVSTVANTITAVNNTIPSKVRRLLFGPHQEGPFSDSDTSLSVGASTSSTMTAKGAFARSVRT